MPAITDSNANIPFILQIIYQYMALPAFILVTAIINLIFFIKNQRIHTSCPDRRGICILKTYSFLPAAFRIGHIFYPFLIQRILPEPDNITLFPPLQFILYLYKQGVQFSSQTGNLLPAGELPVCIFPDTFFQHKHISIIYMETYNFFQYLRAFFRCFFHFISVIQDY